MPCPELILLSEVDEDGFVALVCPDTYTGYIHEGWTLPQLCERFVEQMNAHTLFIAQPGPDAAGLPLRIASQPSVQQARREASGQLEVKKAGLWLTDYAQLTMTAQFSDEQPVTDHHTRLPVPAGIYRVALRQLDTQLELVIRQTDPDQQTPLSALPWLDLNG